MKIPSGIPGSPVKSWCVYISDITESQLSDPVSPVPVSLTSLSQSWMDRLRRSFRSSFRRREELQEESGGPVGGAGGGGRQWPADEAAVKTNSCSFEVKYLGSVEVIPSLLCSHVRVIPGLYLQHSFRFSSPGECRFVKKP